MMDVIKDKRFSFLLILAIACELILALAITIMGDRLILKIFLPALMVAIFKYGLFIFCGIKMIDNLGFQIFSSARDIMKAALLGLALSVIVLLSNTFIFKHLCDLSQVVSKASQLLVDVPLWKKLLSGVFISFFAGGVEEILYRLVYLSAIALFFYRLLKVDKKTSIIAAVVISSLIFVFLHFPTLYALVKDPNIYDIIRIAVPIGFVGSICGWLYCRCGLVSAMVFHFVYDLMAFSWLFLGVLH